MCPCWLAAQSPAAIVVAVLAERGGEGGEMEGRGGEGRGWEGQGGEKV